MHSIFASFDMIHPKIEGIKKLDHNFRHENGDLSKKVEQLQTD